MLSTNARPQATALLAEPSVPSDIVRPRPHDQLGAVRRTLSGDFLPMLVNLEESRGSYLRDDLGGRDLLDMGMFFSSAPIGHNPACLTTRRAAADLAIGARFKPSNPDFATSTLADFVQAFRGLMMPADLPHLFLVEGGGPAVENAMKIAFDWKAKRLGLPPDQDGGLEAMHLEHAFHGRTGYTMSLTNTDPVKVARYPKFAWPRIPAPACAEDGGPASIGRPLTEPELSVLAQVRDLLQARSERIACFVYEPIQGEGGDRHLGAAFLREIERLCRAHDVLLIADEVQTGGGLTGARWAHEPMGLTPDLIAFGKRTQVCGVIGGRMVDEVADNAFVEASRISSTWGGGLIDMVRFTYLYRHIAETGLIPAAGGLGLYLRARLDELASDTGGVVTSVRSRGLFAAVTLPTPEQRNQVLQDVLARSGCVLLPCGRRSVRWRPSLAVTRTELDLSVAAVRAAVARLGRSA